MVNTTALQLHSTNSEFMFGAGSRGVLEICDGETRTVVPDGNKANRLSSVDDSAKTIHRYDHHHHYHHHHHQMLYWLLNTPLAM